MLGWAVLTHGLIGKWGQQRILSKWRVKRAWEGKCKRWFGGKHTSLLCCRGRFWVFFADQRLVLCEHKPYNVFRHAHLGWVVASNVAALADFAPDFGAFAFPLGRDSGVSPVSLVRPGTFAHCAQRVTFYLVTFTRCRRWSFHWPHLQLRLRCVEEDAQFARVPQARSWKFVLCAGRVKCLGHLLQQVALFVVSGAYGMWPLVLCLPFFVLRCCTDIVSVRWRG